MRSRGNYTCTESQGYQACDLTNATNQNQDPGSVSVKDGSDLKTTEEDEEDVYRENPTNFRSVVVLELVSAHIRLYGADGIGYAKAGYGSTPRSKCDDPCIFTSFGVP